MAMASVTRSMRRADGPHHAHQHSHMVATGTRSHQNINHDANATRAKRYLESHGYGFDVIKHKRQRIAVEIPSRLSILPRHVPPTVARPPPPPPPILTTIAIPDTTEYCNSPPAAAPPPPTVPLPAAHQAATSKRANPPSLPNNKKTGNRMKHELDRLKPAEEDINAREQGRKLRSQEASRFKSELSAYFPDYDEIIGNDPKEQHLLNLDTPILVTDSNPIPRAPAEPRPLDSYPIRGYGDSLYTDLFDSQRIDFGFLEARYKNKSLQDPLPDSYFEPSHRKAARLERSIRNSEKGRAQHEKGQIARLLDELQGHDWLRVMGVSGITESKKKQFEPARRHFIKGCQAILDKFRMWTAEEKRRKLEKERALAEAEAEVEASSEKSKDTGNTEDSEDDQQAGSQREDHAEESDEVLELEGGGEAESTTGTPDYSDVDRSAAKQLREEAMAAARSRAKTARSRTAARRAPAPIKLEQPKEFTSFFKKKYQRDAALNKNRRRGRTVMAWGHPVPEMPETDFALPPDFLDEQTLRSHARRKRRDRRGKD